MHSHEKLFADYLIEFEIVDMARRTPLRTVKDQELLMRINPDTWHTIPLHTVADRQWVTPKDFSEQGDRLFRALRNVHPHQCAGALQKGADLGNGVFLHVGVGDRQDPDRGHDFHVRPERSSWRFASF
ncbi:hypothetical protein Adu01nite_50400 [Paractinoplanes durhamensis]|uniref:Uncharacterized protein n=1 Tax=Paractinoplanes durhamensis TaxID=113563 RepID=A0ABQ3Z1I9_9ACTN|nr:hypothetical protein Adu01nite_50400 [Actinoplanes durhamensis]